MARRRNEGEGKGVSIDIGGEEEARLSLSGRLSLENLHYVMAQAHRILERPLLKSLTVDLKGLEGIDSAGGLFLLRMEEEARGRSIPFERFNVSPGVQSIIDLLGPRAIRPGPQPFVPHLPASLFEEVGKGSVTFLGDFSQCMAFGGAMLAEALRCLLHPTLVRWQDVLVSMKKIGVDGLPILALISFLMGLIIAFMSSLQLKQFGANMYVASLVAIAMVRELGPIITAILVAGRSGSAIAAEIGAMRVNEEVDALVTMGFNPIRFLALPKVLAAAAVVPLLTFFSDLFAIVGGMAVGVFGLGLTIGTYTSLTAWALTVFDVVAAAVKSLVFGVLVAGMGCQRGFSVRGGAEAVGNATTSAVVAGLFLIIVTDSVFAVALNYIR
jgi:phospholipid/cholesterol/gamma-HCH transport system permease protein